MDNSKNSASYMINIEVVYATLNQQFKACLHLPSGLTIREALVASAFLEKFPHFNVETLNVGIFSKKKSLETIVQNGDRVEIYRPLVCDPKEQRRKRAGT